MRTGEIEANLVNLNESFKIPYIPELIERKTGGNEKGTLPDANPEFYKREYERLVTVLEQSMNDSKLPEKPSGKAELNDLLIRLRLKEINKA